MKKVMFGLALVATILAVGCKNENKGVEKSEEVALTEYQCPMKCEDGKTYTDKDIKCPICGMELKEVEHNNDHSTHSN